MAYGMTKPQGTVTGRLHGYTPEPQEVEYRGSLV